MFFFIYILGLIAALSMPCYVFTKAVFMTNFLKSSCFADQTQNIYKFFLLKGDLASKNLNTIAFELKRPHPVTEGGLRIRVDITRIQLK